MNEEALPLRPSRSVDLLARAALSDPDKAAAAWAQWRSENSLDEASWAEVRMMAAIAPRIGALEKDADIAPRMRGIQRFLWAYSQKALRGAVHAIAALRECDIPCLPLKGMARIAADQGAASQRLIRDADVLVPVDRAEDAYDALLQKGWSLVEGWQQQTRNNAPLAGHHAWAVVKEGAEFDLHHFSNNLNRLLGDDDRLWRRAQRRVWRGLEVWLPSPADGLLIALAHGARKSADGAADWMVDAFGIVQTGGVDWDIFVEEILARDLQGVAGPSCAYLNDVAAATIPAQVCDALSGATLEWHRQEAKIYNKTDWPESTEDILGLYAGAANRAKSSLAAPVAQNTGEVVFEQTRRAQAKQTSYFNFDTPIGVNPAAVLQLRIDVAWEDAKDRKIVLKILAPGLPISLRTAQMAPKDGAIAFSISVSWPAGLGALRGLESVQASISFADGLPVPAGQIRARARWRR